MHASLKELWLEYVDQERLQYDEREVLSLWEKVQSEPTFLQTQSPGFTDYTSVSNGTDKIVALHLTDYIVAPNENFNNTFLK